MSILTFAMFNGWEIVLILALALILFGAKKLPELARGLGQGIREFRRSTREVTEELEASLDYDSPQQPPQRKISQNPPADTHATTGSPAEMQHSEHASQKPGA